MARFFEYSVPSIVFLIAATVWDSRGVLAFRATICEYGKLLFQGMQKPKQLVNDRFEMKLFGRQQGETFTQIEPRLRAKD